jgi:hypothetical protein
LLRSPGSGSACGASRYPRLQHTLTAGDRSNGFYQVLSANILQHEAGGAGIEQRENVLIIIIGRQGQDCDARQQGLDPAGRFDTRHVRHSNIYDSHIRVGAFRFAYRLETIAGLGYYADIAFRLQQASSTFADQRVIVGKQHLDDTCGIS